MSKKVVFVQFAQDNNKFYINFKYTKILNFSRSISNNLKIVSPNFPFLPGMKKMFWKTMVDAHCDLASNDDDTK